MFGVCAAAFPNAFAQSKPTQWVKGLVVTDGGSVYSQPDFDAPVAEYLPFKTAIWASRTAVPGRGGLGLFHRVHVQNKTGYMADTDIRIFEKGEAPSEEASPSADKGVKDEATKKSRKKVKSKAYEEEEDIRQLEPLYFKNWIGGTVAYTDFSEKFDGKTLRSWMPMYGLRLTGTGFGPPLDTNLMFSLSKPGYYSRAVDNQGTPFAKSVSGFLFFGDTLLMLPIVEQPNFILTYGFGIMYTYTKYTVLIRNSSFDSQEFRIGVDGGLGTAWRFGGKRKKYAIRGDLRYYYEKTQYFGFLTSFQTEY